MNTDSINHLVPALNGSCHSAGAGAASPTLRPVAEYAPHPCEPTFEVPALQQRPDANSQPNEGLQLSIIEHQVSDIGLRAPHFRIRNGKIARLPKLERDMVNRMLHNHVPHAKIVAALDDL